jgi:hypothetical protein
MKFDSKTTRFALFFLFLSTFLFFSISGQTSCTCTYNNCGAGLHCSTYSRSVSSCPDPSCYDICQTDSDCASTTTTTQPGSTTTTLPGSTTTTLPGSTTTTLPGSTTTTLPDSPYFVGATFNITAYIEYLNVFWEARYPVAPRTLAVNCTFYGKSVQDCMPIPYIQPPGKGSCTVSSPAYNYTSQNEVRCRVYDPANPSLYNDY